MGTETILLSIAAGLAAGLFAILLRQTRRLSRADAPLGWLWTAVTLLSLAIACCAIALLAHSLGL